MGTLNAIIIEENWTNANRLKAIVEKECPYIMVADMGIDPNETKNMVANSLYDIIILSFKSGMDYAFELLQKVPNVIEHKQLVLISSEREQILQKISKTAVNFIARPLVPKSVIDTMEKVKNRLVAMQPPGVSVPILDRPSKPLHILAIPSLDEVNILKVADILYLKSDGKYTLFHDTTNKKIMSSTNLGAYEKKLSNNNFFRVHNSYLVNINGIINVHKKDGVYLEMSNGAMIPIAKRKKDVLFSFLGIK